MIHAATGMGQISVEIEGGNQEVYVGVEDAISGRISIMPQEFSF